MTALVPFMAVTVTLNGVSAVTCPVGPARVSAVTVEIWNVPTQGGVVTGCPRWSVVTLAGSPPPLPTAGLPGSRAMVRVGPPQSYKGANWALMALPFLPT